MPAKKKLKVYVAGPYSEGDTMDHIRKAMAVGMELLSVHFTPFIPHLSGFWHLVHPLPYDEWLKYDMEWLIECDCVLRLDGHSPGADKETRFAIKHNIPVFHSIAQIIEWRSLSAYNRITMEDSTCEQ